MERCPACHHKFSAEEICCDLCGLSLESISEPDTHGFARTLLTLAARLSSFGNRAPIPEAVAETASEEQLVRVRR